MTQRFALHPVHVLRRLGLNGAKKMLGAFAEAKFISFSKR